MNRNALIVDTVTLSFSVIVFPLGVCIVPFLITSRQARLIKPCTGVLIYGPPGCGKTLLARAVAKQSGAAFISVKASTLIRQPGLSRMGGAAGGGGIGGGYSSLMVRAVFSLAKKIQPCVIFFDEADGLCLKREEGDAGSERLGAGGLMGLWKYW